MPAHMRLRAIYRARVAIQREYVICGIGAPSFFLSKATTSAVVVQKNTADTCTTASKRKEPTVRNYL